MNRSANLRFLILGIALALVAVVASRTFLMPEATAEVAVKIDHRFRFSNDQILVVDSFTQILRRAYGDRLRIDVEEKRLRVEYSGPKTSAVYNDNKDLLAKTSRGFHASEKNGVLTMTFPLSEGGVLVPNDILLGIAAALSHQR